MADALRPGRAVRPRQTSRTRAFDLLPQALEPRMLFAATPQLAGLTLVNGQSNADIAPLTSGYSIDLSKTPHLNVRANPGAASVGSVKFTLDGQTFSTDNDSIFALRPYVNGDYYSWTPAAGSHTLVVTPFSGDNATGVAGTSITVQFTAASGPAVPPTPVPPSPPPPSSGLPVVRAASTPGLSVTVSPGTIRLPDGRSVAVAGKTLSFAAPEIRSSTQSFATPQNWSSSLQPGTYWSSGVALKPAVDTLLLGGLYKGVVPGSIVVKNQSGSRTFVRDVDYKVNEAFGQVTNLNGRLGTAGAGTVKASFKYVTQRIDLVQVSPSGTVSVKKGTPAVVCPSIPAPDAGHAALAGVYVYTLNGARTSGFRITSSDIFPIDPAAAPSRPINTAAVSRTLSKLRSGESVNIAWFGDSITLGAEAGNWWSDRSKTYTGRVMAELKRRFPAATITETAAYEGGINGATGMTHFQNKVLGSGRKIDLLVIALGMNDTGKPMSTFKSQMANYAQLAKANGMEVLFVTPMMYNPFVEPLLGNAPKSAIAQAILEVAAQENAAAGNVYADWMNQARKGVAPHSQLHNWINHPGEAGMRLYADAILRFFQ